MKVHDIGKMGLLLAVLICSTAAVLVGAIEPSAWEKLVALITGYLIGNGVNAVRGQPGSPVLTTRDAAPALVVGPSGPVGVMTDGVPPSEGPTTNHQVSGNHPS